MMECSKIEQWGLVKGYEGVYSISTFGRVRRDVSGKGTYKNKILSPGKASHGYLNVTLSMDGNLKTHTVHSIVANTFLGDIPRGYNVNHKDTNKLNNRLSNLEYLTPSGNLIHAYANGKVAPKGSSAGMAKLIESQVLDIRMEYKKGGVTQQELAEKYGVCRTVIVYILSRKTWKHI